MNYANKECSADENSVTLTLLLERALDFPVLSSIIIDEVYFVPSLHFEIRHTA